MDRQQDGAAGVMQCCDLQDLAAASPCPVKPRGVASAWGLAKNCFSCPNLPFLYKNKEELLWTRLQWLKGRLASLCRGSPPVFPGLQRTTNPCPPGFPFLQEGVLPTPRNKHWGGGTSAVLQRLERDCVGQCSLLLPRSGWGWGGLGDSGEVGGRKGLGGGNPRVLFHVCVWFSCPINVCFCSWLCLLSMLNWTGGDGQNAGGASQPHAPRSRGRVIAIAGSRGSPGWQAEPPVGVFPTRSTHGGSMGRGEGPSRSHGVRQS